MKKGRDYEVEGESSRTQQWTLETLKQKTAKDFQQLRRLESADADGYAICVTCGHRCHYTDGHGGHWIKRRHNATLFHPLNVNFQCVNCNAYEDGRSDKYKEWLIETHGQESVDELERLKREGKKWFRFEIVAMRAEYRKRIKEQIERLS